MLPCLRLSSLEIDSETEYRVPKVIGEHIEGVTGRFEQRKNHTCTVVASETSADLSRVGCTQAGMLL